jgi:hypothetical protein
MGAAGRTDPADRAGRLAAIEVDVPIIMIAALAATHDRVLSVNGMMPLQSDNVTDDT